MALYSGLTADSAKHLQLDAGCFVKNYDFSKTYEQQKENIIGATAGGGSFSAVPTIRQIEVDGKKGAVKGFQALDEWVVTLTANVKELTAKSLQMALTASKTSVPTAPTGYTKIEGRGEIAATDYHDNIAWVGRISGSQKPVIIVIYNALATNGLTLNFSDKAEAVAAVTLTGHYDLSDLDTPPFAIYYPDMG